MIISEDNLNVLKIEKASFNGTGRDTRIYVIFSVRIRSS